MNKKIAIVIRHDVLIENFKHAINLHHKNLADFGVFYTEHTGTTDSIKNNYSVPVVHADWMAPLIKAVLAWKPDVIWTWNGLSNWLTPGFDILAKNIPVFVSEMGWYRELGSNFIAPFKGHVHMGGTPTKCTQYDLIDVVEKVRNYYPLMKPEQRSIFPETFVFVPLQLEFDTSIAYRSPRIKTMHELIETVKYYFPNMPIVIKHHPLTPKHQIVLFDGVMNYSGPIPSYQIAAISKNVAGINSTVLVESLLRCKAFGDVEGPDKIYAAGSIPGSVCMYDLLDGHGKMTDVAVMKKAREETVASLLNYQYDYKNPPDWIIKSMISGV